MQNESLKYHISRYQDLEHTGRQSARPHFETLLFSQYDIEKLAAALIVQKKNPRFFFLQQNKPMFSCFHHMREFCFYSIIYINQLIPMKFSSHHAKHTQL